MLRVIVTGKPRGWTDVVKATESRVTGRFYLDEKRFVGGKLVEIVWECYVPEHKNAWAKKQVEKGYTVAVEASDVAFRIEKQGSLEWVVGLLMVNEVTGL